MSREDNIAAQEKFAEGVNNGNLDVFDDVMDPEVVDHDPAADQEPGPEGFKRFFKEMRTAFPDLEVSPDHMTATDDDIAMAYTIRGTHQGEFLGLEPTGRRVLVRGCQITRFENGKMVERWGSSNELGILEQLGVLDDDGQQDENKGLADKIRDKLKGQ